MLPLKEFVSYVDKEVNERKEGLNQFNLPLIFDDYSDKEVPGFGNCGDKELLNCKELGEALLPLCFCQEEELTHNEEFKICRYKVTCLHREDQVEATRDFYSSSFLVSSHEPLRFKTLNSCPLNKEPQTHKLSIHALTLDPTSRNPKSRPKKFDGFFF